MSRHRVILICSVLLSLSGLPAWAQMPGMPPHDPGSAGGGADWAMMMAMDRMTKAMNAVPTTGDPDRGFVAMMIPHHQGAIDMANAELRYGKDKTLLKLSREIVTAQAKEIALMRNWQTRHPSAR
jgi:uncharacterized protein (DUF305 family)